MNRGQKIAESLRNPDEKTKIISGCLLLFIITHNPGIDLVRLREKLKKIWEMVHEKDPKFYLFWGKYDDGHNCQNRSLEDELKWDVEMGYIEAFKDRCYITKLGLAMLVRGMSECDLGCKWSEIKRCAVAD